MKKLYTLFIYFIFLLLMTPLSFPQSMEKVSPVRKNIYSGAFALGIDGGITLGRTDYLNPQPNVLGRISLEYLLPSRSGGVFGVKVFASGGYIGGFDRDRQPTTFKTPFSDIAGGLTYAISVQDVVFPYLFGGVAYFQFDPKTTNGVRLKNNAQGAYSRTEFNYLGEIGMHFLVKDNCSINLGFGGELSPNDYWDDKVLGGDNDFMFYITAGVSYLFKIRHDSDGDGVSDDIDQCPNTPKGVIVDDFGCPIDDDNDGVPNYLDKCPNTPRGVHVDADGCPVDNDKDGVPDYLDKCLNTPSGVQVDSVGCPLDSDHDGIPDYLDKCPNTPRGVIVDENGCPFKTKETVLNKIILNGNTNFELNKSTLLSSAYKVLTPLVDAMKNDTNVKIKVAGYTDSTGPEKYNLELSRERAQSVVSYLVSQGIDRNRCEIIAMGENDPIASNSTRDGRAMNRRVEITAISK